MPACTDTQMTVVYSYRLRERGGVTSTGVVFRATCVCGWQTTATSDASATFKALQAHMDPEASLG